jgi:hypothetical protein
LYAFGSAQVFAGCVAYVTRKLSVSLLRFIAPLRQERGINQVKANHDLGTFGLGLKTARSFHNAKKTLTVISMNNQNIASLSFLI